MSVRVDVSDLATAPRIALSQRCFSSSDDELMIHLCPANEMRQKKVQLLFAHSIDRSPGTSSSQLRSGMSFTQTSDNGNGSTRDATSA